MGGLRKKLTLVSGKVVRNRRFERSDFRNNKVCKRRTQSPILSVSTRSIGDMRVKQFIDDFPARGRRLCSAVIQLPLVELAARTVYKFVCTPTCPPKTDTILFCAGFQPAPLEAAALVLLGSLQLLRKRVPELIRKRMYFASAVMILIGVLAMRWNVVIGGQLFSKSLRGLTVYKIQLQGLEGFFMSAALLLLPPHGKATGAVAGVAGAAAPPSARPLPPPACPAAPAPPGALHVPGWLSPSPPA